MDAGGQDPAPSRVVVETLADVDGVDPVDLVPPLATVVDTDALDRLFATQAGTTGRITFQYREYDVTVTSDGDVIVRSGSRPPE